MSPPEVNSFPAFGLTATALFARVPAQMTPVAVVVMPPVRVRSRFPTPAPTPWVAMTATTSRATVVNPLISQMMMVFPPPVPDQVPVMVVLPEVEEGRYQKTPSQSGEVSEKAEEGKRVKAFVPSEQPVGVTVWSPPESHAQMRLPVPVEVTVTAQVVVPEET